MSNEVATQPKLEQPPKLVKRFNKKQKTFIDNWLNPQSDTFGNAYQSAIAAGYSHNAARVITGEAKGLQWVQEAIQVYAAALSPEHIYRGIQHIALNTRSDRDRLTAYQMLMKANGMELSKTEHNVNVTFTNSVPRPVLDLTNQVTQDTSDPAQSLLNK